MKFLISACLLLLAASAGAQDQLPPNPQVELETSAGTIILQLNSRRAPLTVRNFIEHVNDGHYDGTIFHRVIPGFMIQGGGYTADYDPRGSEAAVANESGNGLSNERGTIAMARTNDPHSAAAQFYINVVDNPALDPNPARWGYAVFGEVVRGMEVVDEIASTPTGAAGPFDRDVPETPIVIERARLLDND